MNPAALLGMMGAQTMKGILFKKGAAMIQKKASMKNTAISHKVSSFHSMQQLGQETAQKGEYRG